MSDIVDTQIKLASAVKELRETQQELEGLYKALDTEIDKVTALEADVDKLVNQLNTQLAVNKELLAVTGQVGSSLEAQVAFRRFKNAIRRGKSVITQVTNGRSAAKA